MLTTTTVSAEKLIVGTVLLWSDGAEAPVETLRVSEIKPERFVSGDDYVPIPVDYITQYSVRLDRLDGSSRGSITIKADRILTVLA